MNQQNENYNIYIGVSTIIATIAIEKFKLAPTYYGIFYGLILNLISNIVLNYGNFDYISYLNPYTIGIIFIVPIIFYFSLQYKTYYKKINDEKYIKINIYGDTRINQFTKYTRHFSQFFEIQYDVDVGDKDMIFQSLKKESKFYVPQYTCSLITAKPGVSVKFNDLNLNLKGYYKWHIDNKKITKKDDRQIYEEEITLKYLEIGIEKEKGKNINAGEIYEKINELVNEKESGTKVLYYLKLIKKNRTDTVDHQVQFYNGKKMSFEKKEKIYIDTFFHQEKDRLWMIVKNIFNNSELYRSMGQVGRLSLLLYGPPGTGKSSFAFRTAMCLDRHIISLDLRDIEKKANLYQILHKPCIAGMFHSYKEVLYILEEFDISIKEIDTKTKLNSAYSSKWIQYLNKKSDTAYISDDEEEKEENRDNKDNTKTEKKSTKNKNNEKKSKDSVNPYADPGEFTLRDLLEIFQGPVPFEGMIIIATTNKFDEINKLCPELFRPGRLTPVNFGYITKDVLQDISKFYFKQKLTIYLPNVTKIPTSQIIDLAIESQFLENNKFENFQNKLDKLLND